MNKAYRNLSLIGVLSILGLVSIFYFAPLVWGWTNPSSNPPSGAGVLNFSGGNVGIGGAPGYKFDVQGGQINSSGGLCIAGDCKTAWSQVGGGSITSAANVSSGSFGANTGGGNYTFPANVGIGTTGPSSKLELYDSSSDVQLTINTAGGTPNPIIFLKDGDSATLYGFKMWYDNDVGSTYFDNKYNSDVGNIYFRTKVDSTPVNALTILGSGSVGIGTAAPAYLLDVNGNLGVEPGGQIYARYASSESYKSSLNWYGLQLGNNGDNYIVAGRTAAGGSLNFIVNNTSNFPTVNGTTAMTILTGGNVGIGTASPGYKLDVAGTSHFTSNSYIEGDIYGGLSIGEAPVNYAGWNRQLTLNGTSHARLTVKTGTVQMGVYAHDAWQAVSGVMPGGFIGTYNNYPVSILVNTTPRMVFDTAGNVGIGTASPGQKLSVAGTIESTSGGFKFPDATVQTTAATGGGTINAANVSAGSFGANTGGGNYTFPGNVNISGAYPNGVLTVPSSYIYAQDLYSYSSGKWLSQTLSGSTSYIATDGWVAAWTGTNSLGTAGASGLGGIYITTGAISPAHVRVAINTTTNYNYDLQVNGSFAATSKSFDIQDPRYNDPTKRLVHATLEGPEDAVFYRGEGKLVNGKIIITLPDYFEALTRKENRTVLLTPEFDSDTESISQLAASAVISGKFTVRNIDQLNPSQKFFWEVKAVRSDIAPLQVEIEKATQ